MQSGLGLGLLRGHGATVDQSPLLHVTLTGERTGYYEDFAAYELLGKASREVWVYDGVWSRHRQKTRGRQPTDHPRHAFVVAAQNHDQVGNRAAGERLSAVVDEGRLKAASALLLTTPFTPLLFQGEEWAASTPFQYFTDRADPGLGKNVAEGRRREVASFGWSPIEVPDPQDPSNFERSKVDRDELEEPYHRGMFTGTTT